MGFIKISARVFVVSNSGFSKIFIELISSIFSQGLFMILADLLKMSLVVIIMLVIDWQLSLIVFSVLPIIVYATKLFQRSMKVAFEDVRNQVSILNSFVQERIYGMTLVQMFNREKIDKKKFDKINEKSEGEDDMIDQAYEPKKNSRLSCQITVSDKVEGLVVYLTEKQV